MGDICAPEGPPDQEMAAAGAEPPSTLRHEPGGEGARASRLTEADPNRAECDGPPHKKRKTRRGKSKRRYPFTKNGRECTATKVNKPNAPYNTNQFLLEDHGNVQEVAENLKNVDQVSTISAGRTRDSSFSVDSDGEFYSSPDDEEQYLIKDFVDQYESLQAERLQSMSKNELIEEHLLLEAKLEVLNKRLRKRQEPEATRQDLLKEVERLHTVIESLKRENDSLRKNTSNKTSDSEDSETDSDDSCSTTSSSSGSSCCSTHRVNSVIDYTRTNGHANSLETV